jgi:hypothetical protein
MPLIENIFAYSRATLRKTMILKKNASFCKLFVLCILATFINCGLLFGCLANYFTKNNPSEFDELSRHEFLFSYINSM